MWRKVPAEVLFFLVGVAAVSGVFRSRAIMDPGTLWHIRVGELVLEQGRIWTDPFTFPFNGQTWIPQQWLGECFLALGYSWGGFDTLLFLFAVGASLLGTWFFRELRIAAMGTPLATAVASFALVAAGYHFFLRPHMATIVGMAIVYRVLIAFEKNPRSWRWLWALVPGYVVWTNIHGGMLAGLVTMAVCWFGWSVFARLRPSLTPLPSLRSQVLFVLLIGVCGLTMFVNPYGLEMQRTWFKIVGSPAMAKYVSEHTPLDPTRPGDQAVLVFAVFYLFVLLGLKWREIRVTWFVPIVWLLLTITSIRQGPLFVVVATFAIADCWPHTRWHAWLLIHGDTLARRPTQSLSPIGRSLLAVVFVTIVLGLALQKAGVNLPIVGSGWARLPKHTVPTQLIEPLQNYARSVPPGTPIYNDVNLGGFTIFFAPTLKNFMDDRFELCGDAWLENYVTTIREHPEGIEEWRKQYGFTHALIATGEELQPLELYMRDSGQWREVARDPIAILFEHVGDGTQNP